MSGGPRVVGYGGLLVGALLSVGCGSTGLLEPASTPDQTARIAALEDQVLALRRQHAVDTVEMGRLQQEIERLESELATTRAQAIASADQARIDAATRTVTAPNRIEEDDLEEQDLGPVERTVDTAPPAPPPPTRPRPANVPAGSGVAVTAEGQDIYDRGYTLFHQQRYADAESSFQRFLDREPSTDLSDNAQFWIGECRFARGDYAEALTAFTAVVENYPQGNKVADAMVKAGKSLEQLGDREAAVQSYREVVQRFAGTAAAALADERLAALR